MHLIDLNALLVMAQAPSPATQPDPRAQILNTVGMFAVMGVVAYLLLFRPQQKKAKEHAAMLKAVRAGDKILTSSGIVAVVITVKEKTLTIRSADAKFEITKSAIAEITERSGEPSAS
jgi:preprotein translocase subunit YajC